MNSFHTICLMIITFAMGFLFSLQQDVQLGTFAEYPATTRAHHNQPHAIVNIPTSLQTQGRVMVNTMKGNVPLQPIVNINASIAFYKKLCSGTGFKSGYTLPADKLTKPWTQFSSITAIIFFNFDYYDVIPYLELLYGGLFPRVVYCGPVPLVSSNASIPRPWLSSYKIKFVEYDNRGMANGHLSYLCMRNVMKMDLASEKGGNLNTGAANGGYIIFPDDMLVFPHRMATLNPGKIWHWPHYKMRRLNMATERECDGGSVLEKAFTQSKDKVPCKRTQNYPWGYFNRTSWKVLWKELMTSKDPNTRLYHDRLVNFTGGEKRMLNSWADVYYVPNVLRDDFIRMSSLTARSKVGLDSAVASILVAISSDPSQWETFTGYTKWTMQHRNEPWHNFLFVEVMGVVNVDYYHPTKWGRIMEGSQKLKNFYCNMALPILYSAHGRP